MTDALPSPELTLDPADWDEFRALAHRMVDDTIAHLASLHDQPAWQAMPDSVRASFTGPVPAEGVGAEAAYRDFAQNVRPYPNGNLGPRFWGWVQGTGTPLAMMAEMLASALNPHMAGFDQAPKLVEQQVIAWLAGLMGFPADASGILVAGGTMANVLGLAVARNAMAGFDIRAEGLQGGGPRLMVYGGTETHGWAKKAMELLGLGHQSLRLIPVDGDYRVDVAAMRASIDADRAAGHRPVCIIGTAGTVNTGATDDLRALAALAREQGLWFHVDAAFGGLVRLSPSLAPIVAGMDEADSIGFDLHKWMYQPFEAACVLVRDAQAHRAAFSMTASYLATATRGVTAGGLPFSELGIDLTRGFKALKIWMALKAHGVSTFARLIEQNVAHIQHLAARIEAEPELELLAPVPLNIACFRYAPAGVDEGRLNALNEEILLRLQERGIAVPSGTTLGGRFAIRVANVNHRSRLTDFDLLADSVLQIGREVLSE